MARPRLWVLSESILRSVLKRAQEGEEVDWIIMELYANAERYTPKSKDDDES